MADYAVPVSSVLGDVTLRVRVTGLRVQAVRTWIGVQLLRCAAIAIGCRLEVMFDAERRGHKMQTDNRRTGQF